MVTSNCNVKGAGARARAHTSSAFQNNIVVNYAPLAKKRNFLCIADEIAFFIFFLRALCERSAFALMPRVSLAANCYSARRC